MKVINTFLIKLFLLIFVYLIIDNLLVESFDVLNSIWYHIFEAGRFPIMKLSAFLLESFGYDIINTKEALMIVGSVGILVGYPCVGIGLTYSYCALIIAYPGKLKFKLLFLPIGVIGIYLLNVTRIVRLTISEYKGSIISTENQHDLFNFLIYSFVFLIWVIWVKLESKSKNEVNA